MATHKLCVFLSFDANVRHKRVDTSMTSNQHDGMDRNPRLVAIGGEGSASCMRGYSLVPQ